MARIIALVIGILWLVMAAVAFRNSAAGWDAGHSDLGFWWAVIAVFLTLAGGAAMIGGWIHTRRRTHG